MTVFVDELRKWPTKIRCFKAGSCHLTADSDEELHAFAARLGLRRDWFQPHVKMNHYDLTARRRARAIELGAIETTTREQLRRRR